MLSGSHTKATKLILCYGNGIISFSSALWSGKRVEKNVARPELTKRATKREKSEWMLFE